MNIAAGISEITRQGKSTVTRLVKTLPDVEISTSQSPCMIAQAMRNWCLSDVLSKGYAPSDYVYDYSERFGYIVTGVAYRDTSVSKEYLVWLYYAYKPILAMSPQQKEWDDFLEAAFYIG